jgi:hypothetical protein
MDKTINKNFIPKKYNEQLSFSLPYTIKHEEEGHIIYQRIQDGYVNATAMCKAAGKEWKHYNELESTKAFLKELSEVEKCDIKASAKMTTTALVCSIQGGEPELQGTWIHPQVAINLGQWLSPKFAVKVSKWIFDWMNGKMPTSKSNLPYHLKRYYLNSSNIPLGYFSVLQEMTIMLFGALEMKGYVIPNTMIPDISEGRIFAKFMRDQGINIDEMPTYIHIYEDGRRCAGTKLYPNEYLFAFRQHVIEHWLPKRAIKYFKERDKTALPYINSILQLNAPDTTNKIKGK